MWQNAVTERRFPPPWPVEQSACYAVRDRGGQKLAYVYFKDGLTVDRWGCMNGALE